MLKVTRAALAVEFELLVRHDGDEEILRGVFSKATVGLDTPNARTQSHLDLDMDLETAFELLKTRIYQFDKPSKPSETAKPIQLQLSLLGKIKNSIFGKPGK